MAKDVTPDTKELEAQKVLQEAFLAKQKACTEEVSAVLEKHGFSLTAEMVIGPGRIEPRITIVPKQK